MNYFRCGGGRSTHTATKIDVAKTPLATFESNVSGLYIPEILAYFSATQSGTGDPSPSNPRAINGVSGVQVWGTGKNLINIADQTFTRYKVLDCKFPKGTYTVSAVVTSNDTDASTCLIYFRNKDNSPISYTTLGRNTRSSANITLDDDVEYIYLYSSDNNTHSQGDTATWEDIQIEVGSTATPYEAYTGTTATTALGGTYYGGYLNVTTGLLTVTHGYAEYDGSNDEAWTYVATDTYRIAIPPDVKTNSIPTFCNEFKPSSSTLGYEVIRIGVTNIVITSSIGNRNADDFKAFLSTNHLQVVYELATPFTVQLTPAQIEQLLGQNNVFCSSGDVAVKYWKID